MKFSDIMGHEREKGILARAITSGRVPHSYIFSGPGGVGKMMAARAFATSLNCEEPDPESGDACGGCESCLAVEAGSHLNLTFVEPIEGYVKIEQVRELQRALRLKAERGYKVAVIDGADAMGASPANALLKTLEEPPAGSVIVLVTSRPALLLPTIQSRCRRLNFGPLPTELIAGVLGEAGVGEADSRVLAALSLGSVSAALEAAESGLYEGRLKKASQVATVTLADKDGLLKMASALAKDDDIDMTLEYLKILLRDAAVSGVGVEPLTAVGRGSWEGPLVEWRRIDTEHLTALYEAVERARVEMLPPRNANKQLTMEVLLMELAGALARRRAA